MMETTTQEENNVMQMTNKPNTAVKPKGRVVEIDPEFVQMIEEIWLRLDASRYENDLEKRFKLAVQFSIRKQYGLTTRYELRKLRSQVADIQGDDAHTLKELKRMIEKLEKDAKRKRTEDE
jgi:hypothetical protein